MHAPLEEWIGWSGWARLASSCPIAIAVVVMVIVDWWVMCVVVDLPSPSSHMTFASLTLQLQSSLLTLIPLPAAGPTHPLQLTNDLLAGEWYCVHACFLAGKWLEVSQGYHGAYRFCIISQNDAENTKRNIILTSVPCTSMFGLLRRG